VLGLAWSIRRRPPTIVHTHTPIGGLVGRLAAILAGHKTVVHTFHGLPFQSTRLSLTERAFLVVERLLAKRTAYFFSQSSGDAERAVALKIAKRDKLTVIGNGVDLSRFRSDPEARAQVRGELEIASNAIVVVTAARLVREKGLLELASAAEQLAEHPQVHFLVLGQALPSDRTDVTFELDAHPVVSRLGRRWRRLGYRADIHRVLAAADIFALPSYREGLPRSVIEAFACGLAVVATDISGCRELVEPGKTGLLVPARDSDALARALALLIADPSLRAAMGERAQRVALERHDERKIVALQVRLLERLAPN
jgi:glycosyltransferase involved in cell wall biosynthesis